MISDWLKNNTGIADIMAAIPANEEEIHVALTPLARLILRKQGLATTKRREQSAREVADLLAAGMTVREIATQRGVSRASVYELCRRHGIQTPVALTGTMRRKPEKKCPECGGLVQLTGKYCSSACVNAARSKRATKSFSKITIEDARQIRKLRKDGLKLREIGEKFGLSATNVREIVAGRTWKE